MQCNGHSLCLPFSSVCGKASPAIVVSRGSGCKFYGRLLQRDRGVLMINQACFLVGLCCSSKIWLPPSGTEWLVGLPTATPEDVINSPAAIFRIAGASKWLAVHFVGSAIIKDLLYIYYSKYRLYFYLLLRVPQPCCLPFCWSSPASMVSSATSAAPPMPSFSFVSRASCLLTE